MNVRDLSYRSILIGTAIALAVFLGVRFIFQPLWEPVLRALIILAGAPVGTFIGGYYAARRAANRPVVYGLGVSILAWLVLVVLRMIPIEIVLALLVIGFGPAGAYFALSTPYSVTSVSAGRQQTGGWGTPFVTTRRTPRWQFRNPLAPWMSKLRANQQYQILLRRVRMDAAIAERLIELERRRNPFADREKLIRNALERLDRDNR